VDRYRVNEGGWQGLRASRWDPPGRAAESIERRRTYVFALEQAEQMFRAAASVDSATRPPLAFYGLNQAGRAIAAAACQIETGEEWRLQGHGIHARSETLRGPLPDVEVVTDSPAGTGSFVRLSELLNSPVWQKSSGITLGKLWDCLPENRTTPIGEDDQSRRTPLYVDHLHAFGEPHPLVSVPVAYFPPWVISAADKRKVLTEYLVSFPGAYGYDSYYLIGDPSDGVPDFTAHDDGWGELMMNWEVSDGRMASTDERLRFLEARTRMYEGGLFFFPMIRAEGQSLHPLLAWWAVLYVLSMLARYQPAEWSQHIDINYSRHAVPIESLLKEAIANLPGLIAEAIDEVVRRPD
jgi:hypothetical protein